MTKSAEIQDAVLRFLADQTPRSVQEIKTYLQMNDIVDYTEGQFAGSINTLLRNGSIKKLDRGVYTIKPRSEDMKKCFVISPIGNEESETRKHADKVFRHIIAPVCESTGFEPIRVDKLDRTDTITQTIIEALNSAELVIADITGHNPNVFYEMGYRASTGRPIIHLRSKSEDIPFDVAGIRAFDYDLSDLDSVEEVKSRLSKTIKAIPFEEPAAPCVPGESQSKESGGDMTQMIVMLYGIHDELRQMREELRRKDTETIQAIVRASAPAVPAEDPNTAIMKAILPELLRNPGSMKTLIQLGEMADKMKGTD